jgi:signal recognition particle subunit SEC65
MSSWACVYPVYIDLKKSRKEGRKIPAANAIEDPSAIYMVTAAQKLGFEVGLEPSKRHPRDPFNFGRLRIRFKQNGKLMNPKIDTKTKLYTLIAKGMADAIKDTPDEDGNVAKYASHARSVLNIPKLTDEEESSTSTAAIEATQIEPAKAPEPATSSAPNTSESISKKKKKDKKEKKRVFRG